MDHEVLKEMEKALEGNKTLETLKISGNPSKEFCRHLMMGIGLNTSLSEVYLNFYPNNWDCPIDDGRLVHVSHMLCDSVAMDVVYSV